MQYWANRSPSLLQTRSRPSGMADKINHSSAPCSSVSNQNLIYVTTAGHTTGLLDFNRPSSNLRWMAHE